MRMPSLLTHSSLTCAGLDPGVLVGEKECGLQFISKRDQFGWLPPGLPATATRPEKCLRDQISRAGVKGFLGMPCRPPSPEPNALPPEPPSAPPGDPTMTTGIGTSRRRSRQSRFETWELGDTFKDLRFLAIPGRCAFLGQGTLVECAA